MATDPDKAWFASKDAARYIGVTDNYLRKLRVAGTGPEFSRIGPRCIRYSRASLDQWMADRSARSTSEYADEAA